MSQDQKKLPWFKFTPNEWLTGNIVGEDMCCHGLFINICAYYWKEGGNVPLSKIERRYGKYDSFQIIKDEYLKVNDGIVNIGFLDEQLREYEEERKVDAENGKKGAEKRWGGHRGAINGQWPNMADKDIDKEKDKEKEYTLASPSEISRKKYKTDPRVGKSLKKLNSAGGISLAEVEELFYPGLGTQHVIEEFQDFFAEIGYSWKSDMGVKTVYMSWVNQLKHKKEGDSIDKQIIPSSKLTDTKEEEWAKFQSLKLSVGFLGDFLCQETPEDRKSIQRHLIAQYGLEGTVRLIATYWAKSPGGPGRNTWRNYQALIDNLSLSEKEWAEIVEGNSITI
mgnify:CR=1 FL=1